MPGLETCVASKHKNIEVHVTAELYYPKQCGARIFASLLSAVKPN
jgi:hypothetical protein